jgi:hypothetical protein
MTTLIHYRGELVAIAGPERFYLAPHVATRPPSDPLRAMAALMCVFAQRVRDGDLATPYSDERAERYARTALIDDDEFAQADARGHSDDALAAQFNVPVEQIDAKRRDLGLAAG